MPESQDHAENKMFSKAQVSLATFLGAPIAGAILMCKNCKAMGQPKGAQQSITTGIIGTVIILVIAFFLPDNIPDMILPIASLFAVQQWYKQTQEESFKSHISRGGGKGSWWFAIRIGLSCLILIFAVIFGVVMVLPESMLG